MGSHEYASAVWVRGAQPEQQRKTDSFWFLFERPWYPFPGTKITEGQVGWPVKSGVRKVEKVALSPVRWGTVVISSLEHEQQ